VFTQKGASQQGFPLLFLLFFPPPSIAVARSRSESRPGSCSLELGLEELKAPADGESSGLLAQMLPTLRRLQAGLPAPCLLPARRAVPLPGPKGFCLQGGVGLAEFLEFILNPPLGSGGRFPWGRVTVPGWDGGQGWVARRGAPVLAGFFCAV